MRARPGDRIVIDPAGLNGRPRVGIVTGVGHQDGYPPYRVHWLDLGHTTLLFPGLGAHIEPGNIRIRET
ncbi:hypothetical protein GCM10010168_77500 [Actinoplanes ianthinogenes]|uniref:DUF1918 domain-containing protein n=1 Tax=Actinoplanes ianthinogenes TaxID=122358 RepID=A0ABM7M9I3_9ACTN|nr:DUF1918 domain-containing protein [Actinoplanes ianthinogenes]BCJ48324.1 hypothetical protein Aiant_89810 [Actinoplanes ianthinogenes]GGR47143.1 hypothetical protein GCM10010168_77500 [Actinoplanes ianthinogenes]